MLEEPPAVSMTVLKLSHHHQQLSAAKDKTNSVAMATGGGTGGGISPAATAKIDSLVQVDSHDETNAMATTGGIVKPGVQLPPQPQVSNHEQQQTTNSRTSHISFSVAALLADTRPTSRHRSPPAFLTSQSPPLESSTHYHSEQPLTSSDEELNDDESEQGSAVDVEVLRDSNSPVCTPTPLTPPPLQPGGRLSGSPADVLSARFMLAGGHGPGGGVVTPVRPTPFSALAAAAAAYSAGLQHHHPAPHHQPTSWAASTLVGHYPGAMFPGPAAAAAAFAAAGLAGSPGEQDRTTGGRNHYVTFPEMARLVCKLSEISITILST
jgi:hypothetical protein